MEPNEEHGEVPGGETPPEKLPEYPEKELPDLWYTSLAKRLWGGRYIPAPAKPFHDADYKPSFYYRRLKNRAWPGPVYFTERRRRADMLHVISQMSALIRINAPLVEGLEMLGREERWIAKQMGAKRLLDLLAGLIFLAIPTLFGLNLAIRDPFMTPIETLLIPIPFILFGLLLFFLISQRGHRVETIYLKLRDGIASGMRVHEAMRVQRRIFPAYCLDIIQAGEEGGRLAEAFDQVGDVVNDVIRLARHGFLTLLYVFFVACASLTVCAFLCTKVLPVFSEILEEFGVPVPRISQYLIASADIVARGIMDGTLPACLVAIFAVWVVSRFIPRFLMGPVAGRLYLMLPIFRGLAIRFNAAHIARLLGVLFTTGTPAPEALEIAARGDLAPAYRRLLRKARARVLEGESISDAMRGTRLLPKSFLAMMTLGERSGDLPRAFGQLAAYYGALYETRAKMMVDGLLPIGVVALGFLVMFVHIGSFMMIIAMTSGFIDTL